MPIYALDGERPTLPEKGRYWVAPDAHVIGRVRLGLDVGIWFGAVLRGDNEPIVIGDRSNIQEGAMLHTDPGCPLTIGADCTIGHHAIIHGGIIGANSLVGMGATILNGARIGANSLVGANAGIGISLGDDCVVEAGCYVTAGTKVNLLPGGRVIKAGELSGANGLLFRRNSLTGAVEAVPREGKQLNLNAALHANG